MLFTLYTLGRIYKMKTSKKGLFILLGISLVTQATTSLVGGLVGIGPFTETGDMAIAMNSIADSIDRVYIGILLQIVTALVIVVLAAALYQASSYINKTVAVIATGFYLTEAAMHIAGQVVAFGIAEAGLLFDSSGDAALATTAGLLFTAKDFLGAITMIPFGLGAILFYYLITKAEIIPKWLGLWGIATVTLVLVGWSLEAFRVVSIPFALYVPYVPWEWVAGIYILVKALSPKNSR